MGLQNMLYFRAMKRFGWIFMKGSVHQKRPGIQYFTFSEICILYSRWKSRGGIQNEHHSSCRIQQLFQLEFSGPLEFHPVLKVGPRIYSPRGIFRLFHNILAKQVNGICTKIA